MAVLAQSGPSKEWFAARLANDLAAEVPLRKARAILLRGFVGSDEPPSAPLTSVAADVIEWQDEQQENALRNWRRDVWAQTWFARFAAEESDDVAMAAFRLFLSCVDSRFSSWGEGALAGAREDRRRFVVTAEDEIGRAIQENESDCRKTFLGMEVAERQIWPWL